MQPLTLHLEGLHSFREPVEVDFGELAQHGLFGIFGPTGSGKSSLLDALTLSLYGQVDRIQGRSRRGLVNHNTSRCEVRLRFRCRDGEYEVQRAYKKDADGVAQRIHSRLLEHTASGPQVLADKEREVNSRIEALVGLNASDFMRAVVLPQGRFMQFLHLQGADRRRMLQRIFHLEAYGEELRARVKTARNDAHLELERVSGELDGLGEASPADLKVSRQAKKQAQAETEAARARRSATTRALEAARQRHAHHAELGRARDALATHLANADEMARRGDAAELARRARPVLEVARRVEQAEREHRSAVERKAQLDAELDRVRQDEQRHGQAWTVAAEERSREEPGLLERREALREAVRLEKRVTELTAEARALDKQRSALSKKLHSDELTLKRLESEVTSAVTQRTQLAREVGDHEVPQAHRERITRADTLKLTLDNARKRAAELKASLDGARSRKQVADEASRKATEAVERGQARRDRAERWTHQLQANLEALAPLADAARRIREAGLLPRLDEAHRRLREASSALEQAEAELNEVRASNDELATVGLKRTAAGVLANHLEGACPVCGSEDHPSPATPTSPDALLEVIEQAAAQRARLEVATAGAERCRAERSEASERHDALRAELPEGIGDAGGFVEREQRARRTLERALARSQDTVRALDGELEQARQLLTMATAQRGSLADQEARERIELDEALKLEGDAWGELTATLGELTLFDLPRLVAEIRDKDRARAALSPRLNEAEHALARQTERFERKREQVAQRRSELDRITRDHQRIEQERRNGLHQLHELLPEGVASEVLAQVDARLEALAAAVNTHHRAREHSRQTLLEVTASHSDATGRSEAAAKVVTDARQALAQALGEHGFTEVPTADAGLPEVDLGEVERELRQWHTQRGALELRVEQLGKVELDPIDGQALQAIEADAEQAARLATDAEAELARLTAELAQLEARAERHAQLSTRHAKLSQRARRLDELSRLLRGDRFVEYVANDHLSDLVREATRHLAHLTRGRYALDLDDQGGFLVADLDAGGALRPAHSLSGGETFLTSLALALALSTQVQQHNDQALDFFFLDEGFGSLDPEALDRVMSAIEQLGSERQVIGLISHISAVKERVPRYLQLANPRDGTGTTVALKDG